MDGPGSRLPTPLLLQLHATRHGGLETTQLPEDLDVALDDRLLDPGDLLDGLGVGFGVAVGFGPAV